VVRVENELGACGQVIQNVIVSLMGIKEIVRSANMVLGLTNETVFSPLDLQCIAHQCMYAQRCERDVRIPRLVTVTKINI
jgi:hypothetical protein